MKNIQIRKPDDFHLHLRQGEFMPAYARETGRGFARALVMPNTLPPITDPAGMLAYKKAIEEASPGLEALMSFKILPGMKGEVAGEMKEAGALVGKLYPAGATTNAEDGVSSLDQIQDILAGMEEAGLVLSIHGEDPEASVPGREIAFHKSLERIVDGHPRLKVVLEHVSCRQSLEFLKDLPSRVAGTLTAHHLLYSMNDLLGGALNPHLFCKPVLKEEKDRKALVQAACSGNPRFFFGSDSAPHLRAKKEGPRCAAGVFSSPVCLPLLAELFEREGALEALEGFVSERGAAFYGLPLNEGLLTLEKGPFKVPELIGGAVPLMAGQTLKWRIAP